MNKLKNTVLVTILDLMVFLASFNIQEKQYSLIISGVCILIMLILSKMILDIVIKLIQEKYKSIDDMFIELKNNDKENINLVIDKINEVHLQNEKLLQKLSKINKDMSDNLLSSIDINKTLVNDLNNHNVEINKILENNSANMSNEVLKCQNQNLEIIKNIKKLFIEYNEKLLSNIESMNMSLANNINIGINNIIEELSKNDKKLSDDLSNSIQKIDNIFGKSNEVISKSFSDINSEIQNNNETSINRLDELSKDIVSNLQDMGLLFDSTLNEMKSSIEKQNEKNNRDLNRSIEVNIKKLKKEIAEGNDQSIDILDNMKQEQGNNIKEIKDIIQKITELQKELLDALYINQQKMLELNEEDINLMKEMVR